jgi:sortase A
MLVGWKARAAPQPTERAKPPQIGTLRKVAVLARTSMTLVALVVIGVMNAMRTKGRKGKPTSSKAAEAISSYGRPVSFSAPTDLESKPTPKPKRRGRFRRRLGMFMIAVGIVLVGYSAAVIFWGDPVTYVYAHWKQHQLASELNDEFESYTVTAAIGDLAVERTSGATPLEIALAQRELVERAANRLNPHLKMSHPLGRIRIPEMGVTAVFVQGTRWGPDLSQGPGHYPQTSLPGVGRTVGIAAHRTTFGAWFRKIDSLRSGDQISLRLPYATFHYQVFSHEIVKSGDWSVIRDRGFDTLVLSACHPLYSASHRWIVYAALVRVDPVRGVPYLVNRRNEVRPLTS